MLLMCLEMSFNRNIHFNPCEKVFVIVEISKKDEVIKKRASQNAEMTGQLKELTEKFKTV